MYIRNREEALDALSDVLALTERREQIIRITVKVALCLDADARRFLADAQAGLIDGGLEAMRRKRQVMMEAVSDEGGEAIVLIDSSEDQLLEAVGQAMDALRLSEIIVQVFPEVGRTHQKWQVARAVVGEEQSLQEAVITAVKERTSGNTKVIEEMQAHVIEKLRATRPTWMESAVALKTAIEEFAAGADGEKGTDPVLLFNVIATHEDSARLVLDLLTDNRLEARAYVNEVRTRIEQLQALEERNAA